MPCPPNPSQHTREAGEDEAALARLSGSVLHQPHQKETVMFRNVTIAAIFALGTLSAQAAPQPRLKPLPRPICRPGQSHGRALWGSRPDPAGGRARAGAEASSGRQNRMPPGRHSPIQQLR